MTEPLPEMIQIQLNLLREDITNKLLSYKTIAEQIGTLCLNAYNVGKDPSYEVVPLV